MAITFRVYYWLQGASGSRGVSPWKYQDFSSREELEAFVEELRPLINKYAAMAGESMPSHPDPMDIRPPRQIIEAADK